MRRVGIRYAKPGMVLGRAVYDSGGNMLADAGTALSEDTLATLGIYGVREVLIHDRRLADVPVQPLIAPEIEAQAVQALRQLLTECQGSAILDDTLLGQVEQPIYAMVRELFPDVAGEINASGCYSGEEFTYVRPVKAAVLCLLMGRWLGFHMAELASIGLAAALMDVGYIVLPQGPLVAPRPWDKQASPEQRKHPQIGAEILGRCKHLGPEVARAVLQHHETWNGEGYPGGLRGEQISLPARILSIADAYYELISEGPNKRAFMPHEAVEFIMAYSGELFDPRLVQLFARQVPLYPAGTTVRLNTGEVAVVIDANLGHVGRPVIRVFTDPTLRMREKPDDRDLSESNRQSQLIVQVVG